MIVHRQLDACGATILSFVAKLEAFASKLRPKTMELGTRDFDYGYHGQLIQTSVLSVLSVVQSSVAFGANGL
jgi:hypothetical protein